MLPRVLRKGSASLMTEESSGNTVKLSGKSYQAFATALGSKDLPSCTMGKLVGMVRMQRIGIIRSQVLQGENLKDAVQRLNVGGSRKWPKIQSTPVETRFTRGMNTECHLSSQESL